MAQTLSEIGSAGLEQFGGFIQQDFLQDWRGKKAYKNANEMRLNSPVIAALINAIEQSVRSVDWQWTSDVGEEDPRLQLIQDSLDGMSHSWNDHVIEALTFLPFGFAPFEIVYKRDGGRILWRKFAIRGQDTVENWVFDDEGGIAGFRQAIMGKAPVFIPIERLILYRSRVERNNPEGRSILRPAYIPYYYAKNIAQIEAIGVERDLAGLPVLKLPEGSDPGGSDADEAKKLVRRVRNDEQAGLVLPFGWEFELVNSGGSRLFDTNEIISRYEKRMLMSALAQFLVLGMDNVGSLALSADQTDFFNMSVNATADIIAEAVTKHAIPRLMRLNGMDDAGLRLEHSPAGDVDMQKLTASLQAAAPMLTWTVDDEIWLRGAFGLPEKAADELVVEREAKQQQLLERQAAMRPFQQEGKFAAGKTEGREQHESRWGRLFKGFFDGQRERVLKAARKL